MAKMRNILFLMLLILPNLSWSQSKKVWIRHADEFFEKEDYYNALLNYQNALSDSVGLKMLILPYDIEISNQKLKKKKEFTDSTAMVPTGDYLNHQIAVCHLKTADYDKAVESFQDSLLFQYYPDDQYAYGVALMNTDQHQKAIDVFDAYINSRTSNDSLLRGAQLSITGCFHALDKDKSGTMAKVNLMDTNVFNKGTASFGVQYFGRENRVTFSSAREGGVIIDPEKQDSKFLLDIYYAEKNDNGDWNSAINFGRPLNSAQNDAASCYGKNDVFYYTKWDSENPKERYLVLTRMVDFKFYESYRLPEPVNVEGFKSIQPYVTSDGKLLYFSSDRPGGYGGMDLWRIKLDEQGLPFGEPENLGQDINSDLDEVTPFYHEYSTTLFFSSNGHNSIGGLDVFKSTYNLDNKSFGRPENMGTPINSSMDDSYLIWDKMLDKGFLSSDREDCEAGHCYNIYEISNEPIVVAVEGFVYDKDTDKILPGAELTFKDVGTELEPFMLLADSTGFYHQELKLGEEWFIKAKYPDYFADATSVNTENVTESKVFKRDLYLVPIPKDEIEIEGIEYDFDSANLRDKSKEILDELYDFLMLNDNLIVEINSHTDERGSAKYNMNLSKRRAQSCVDYLISKGIAPKRVIAKGYGEDDPTFHKDENKKHILDSNGEKLVLTPEYIRSHPKEKHDELHQRNRRTAFKVVGDNINLESN